MKHLKYFESNLNKPKINDYVLCDIKLDHWLSELNTYCIKNVGQIINIEKTYSRVSASIINERYIIKYEKNLRNFGYFQKDLDCSKSNIIMWAENKEEILNYIETLNQKEIYNL